MQKVTLAIVRHGTSFSLTLALLNAPQVYSVGSAKYGCTLTYMYVHVQITMREHQFYYWVIRFEIFRVNRGTLVVNSHHVTQTRTSVYFGTDVLQ